MWITQQATSPPQANVIIFASARRLRVVSTRRLWDCARLAAATGPAMPRTPGPSFALALGMVALIGPLAVHLFFPVIPAVKAAFALSDALAQFTFSIALIGMGAATLAYGTLADRLGRRPVLLSG